MFINIYSSEHASLVIHKSQCVTLKYNYLSNASSAFVQYQEEEDIQSRRKNGNDFNLIYFLKKLGDQRIIYAKTLCELQLLYAEKHRDRRPELIKLFCETVSIDLKKIIRRQTDKVKIFILVVIANNPVIMVEELIDRFG